MSLLGCGLRTSSQKKDKGHKKRNYVATTLKKSYLIEDGVEEEEYMVVATKYLERSFNKEEF